MSNTNYCKSIFACPLLCIFCLFLPVLIFSQVPITTGQSTATVDHGNFSIIKEETISTTSELDAYRAKLESYNPPTGILYDMYSKLSNVELYDGTSNSPLCSRAAYNQIMFELQQAGLEMPEALQNPSDCKIDNIYEYEVVQLSFSVVESDLIDIVDGYPYGTMENIIASADRDSLFNGENTIFQLKTENFRVKHPDYSTDSQIYIDFDDGAGYQLVNLDQHISIKYNSKEQKIIRLQLDDDNPNTHNAQFAIYVRELKYPPHSSFFVTAKEDYNGRFNTAIVTHFSPLTYSNSSYSPETARYKMEKPIIFVEGFDPIDDYTAGPIYHQKLNRNGLAECLLENGYDLIIVDFCQNRDYIQNNAMVLMEVLQQINDRYKISSNSNIVIGASMGGLISKYALRYMEKNDIQHETSTFVTIDTPHKGANIILGFQHYIDFFASVSNSAKEIRKVINSVAAQQMLIYHYKGRGNIYRSTLNNEFENLGHPQNCRTVAISNGNPHGVGLDFNPADLIFKMEVEVPLLNPYAKIWALSQNRHKIGEFRIIKYGWIYYGTYTLTHYSPPNTYLPLDNAPGGFRNTLQETARQLERATDQNYVIKQVENFHCFVPTISSLALDVEELNYDIDGNKATILNKTPFDDVYYPSDRFLEQKFSFNQEHVKITDEMDDWLVNELTRTNIVLDGSTWNYGEYKATESIRLLPGYQSDDTHLKIGSKLNCN